MKKERNSNFELLRIVSMILIVAHHYSIHGEYDTISGLHINKLYVQFLSMGGKLGVNLFVLTTGFFMINSTLKLKSVIKLISQTWFYSISLLFIAYYFNLTPISINQIVKSVFPILFSSYWFITVFIVLYLLIPFLNIYINKLDYKKYSYLIILMIILQVLIPKNLGFGNVDWFIFLYFLGGYISKFPKLFTKNNSIYLTVFMVAYFSIFVTIVIFDYFNFRSPLYFIASSTPFILISSISLFSFFKNLKTKNNKYINLIASSVFGVYLIHDNMFIRPYIWKELFKNNDYYFSNYLYIHSFIAIILVFIISIIIDLFRIKIVSLLKIEFLQDLITHTIKQKKNYVVELIKNI